MASFILVDGRRYQCWLSLCCYVRTSSTQGALGLANQLLAGHEYLLLLLGCQQDFLQHIFESTSLWRHDVHFVRPNI